MISGKLLDLKYSRINRRLIGRTKSEIFVLDLDNNRVDLKFCQTLSEDLLDFAMVGKLEEKIISFTCDGYISFVVFNYLMKKVISSNHHKIELTENECLSDVGVKSKINSILVFIDGHSPRSSRAILFDMSHHFLVQKAFCDIIPKIF